MFLTAFCDGSFLICLTENRERVSIAKIKLAVPQRLHDTGFFAGTIGLFGSN